MMKNLSRLQSPHGPNNFINKESNGLTSNSFIDMKTVFSKQKNLKRKQLVFFLVVSFDRGNDCNKNRLLMENNQPETKFGALI